MTTHDELLAADLAALEAAIYLLKGDGHAHTANLIQSIHDRLASPRAVEGVVEPSMNADILRLVLALHSVRDGEHGEVPQSACDFINSTLDAESATSWVDLETHLREMLLGGQGDDDGPQIMPDFQEGQSTVSMIGSCLWLLETRRDVIEAQQNTIAQLRHQLTKIQPAAVEGVVVKALEWVESEGVLLGQRVWSTGDPWLFWIVFNRDREDYIWCESLNIEGFLPASPVRGKYQNLEDAKAAAQADFEARILSCLSTPEPPKENGEDERDRLMDLAFDQSISTHPYRQKAWAEAAKCWLKDNGAMYPVERARLRAAASPIPAPEKEATDEGKSCNYPECGCCWDASCPNADYSREAQP
jgi:hypothetical protein